MTNLETTLRRALAKGDISDPVFRRRVYTAAANAMEKSLSSRPEVSAAMLAERRKGLASVITGLEAEIVGTRPPVAPPKPATPPVPEIASPVVTAAPMLRAEPKLAVPDDQIKAERRDEPQPASRQKRSGVKRNPFAASLSVTVAVALVIVGFMFIWTTGAFQSAAQRDTSVPNPPAQLDSENSSSASTRAPALEGVGINEEQARAEGWITVFTPGDPTSLTLVGGAEATIQTDPFGDYAHLITPTAKSGVLVDVPVGVLDQLQGQQVQINIIARADDGLATEMSVTCDFGALGDCGRRRFNVGPAPSEYLFRIDLPQSGRLDEGGTIRLQADINNYSNALNLLAVRARSISAQ